DLRIVPTEALLSHERHDAQRTAPLVKYLRRDGVLKNPPIVTPSGLDDNTYVMLDGANRIFALNELGIRHTLVQVVPYTEPHVDLRIVPTEALLSHERHDAQRTAPLVKYLRRDGVLKNPPIVTPSGLDDNTYVMLDGANRIFALNELGIRHTLVQVVPYTEPH